MCSECVSYHQNTFIYDCGIDEGSGTGPVEGGSPGGAGSGPNNTTPSPYNSFIFSSVDDLYLLCQEGDATCLDNMMKIYATIDFFKSLGIRNSGISSYNDLFNTIQNYLEANNYSDASKNFLKEKLISLETWRKQQDNSTDEKKYNNYKFVNWAVTFFIDNPTTTWVQFQNWFINGNLDFQNNADVEFAADLSGLSHDLVLANQNGNLNQLQASWPNWEKVKQKIKNSIAQGVHQTAKIVKTYYDEVTNNPYTNNAATRVVLNVYIDALRNEIKQTTNMNKDTMNWQDLYNIWLFELMPNPYSSINFTWNSNVINGNNLYNANTNAVYKFPKGSPDMMNDIKNGLSNGTFNVENNMSGYFWYNFTQYYATLSNNNLGIQMLGSYPIKATVVSKSGNSAVVRFYILNTLGWESATRFVRNINAPTSGVIPNKEIGEGIHLGGNLENTYIWEEIVVF